MSPARGFLALTMVAGLAVPALAADPAELGVFKSWTAYSAAAPEGKVCYALSKPTVTNPKKAARDSIYLMISTWPGRNAKDEVEVVPGYTYRDGDPVFAEVGNAKTEFFSRNDGKSGAAWVKNQDEETAFVKALRGGSTVTVTGISKKGTKTVDTYSLSGIAQALDRAHKECGK
jgi:hypothetical protein